MQHTEHGESLKSRVTVLNNGFITGNFHLRVAKLSNVDYKEEMCMAVNSLGPRS
jgi:hypothetical protein